MSPGYGPTASQFTAPSTGIYTYSTTLTDPYFDPFDGVGGYNGDDQWTWDDGQADYVSFASSAAGAAHELTVMRSARAKQCLAEYFRLLLTGKDLGGAVIGRVSVSVARRPAGHKRRLWLARDRAAADARAQRAVLPGRAGFVYGASEVTLQSSGIILPFPAAAQEELFKLLLRRARTQPL